MYSANQRFIGNLFAVCCRGIRCHLCIPDAARQYCRWDEQWYEIRKKPCSQWNCMAFACSIGLEWMFPITNTILRGFLLLWRRNFLYENRRWHFAFSASKEDLNGRFFIFKRTQSRFGEKIPNTALFCPENLSQSFRRFLVCYAESVESHHSRLVRHFCFPLYIYKERELMPMKKITFNAPLNHKAHNYKPMQIEVEKVIPLYGKRFEQMRDHPLDDCPEIIENRDLMYMK